MLVGFREIMWPVLSQGGDQEFCLKQVLARLEAIATNPALTDDQLVDGKPLWLWDLNQDALAIQDGGRYRLGNEIVQMMQCLTGRSEQALFGMAME